MLATFPRGFRPVACRGLVKLEAAAPNHETSRMKTSTIASLKHHFLIAMPHMADPRFAQALIYLVEHNQDGAMGLVVNRPSGLHLADIMEQLRPDTPAASLCQTVPVYSGGPVQTDRGFVLHPADRHFQATLALGELGMTTSQDVLFAIADEQGPERHFIALGYAGWGTGQLEAELAQNAWLSCPAQPRILFDLPHDQRLDAAAASLGIHLSQLSSQVGHA